jgi:hypothetical protein
MFGNDVPLLLGTIEKGKRRKWREKERESGWREKNLFSGGFWEVVQVYSVQPAFLFWWIITRFCFKRKVLLPPTPPHSLQYTFRLTFVTDVTTNIMERDSVETVPSRINPEVCLQCGIQINETPSPSSYKMWKMIKEIFYSLN